MNRTGPDWLHDRIAAGELVIIDGATGSELEARGVPMVQKGWSVLAQLEYPDILRTLHEDYIRSGASVIITNTFGAGRHLLEPGGLGDRVAEAHTSAVQIARQACEAADGEVAVAGSISTYMADHDDPHWLGRLDETYREQVALLVDAGVDLIALEMIQQPDISMPAVHAALESGLPVWVGVSAQRIADRGDEIVTLDNPEVGLDEIVDLVVAEPIGVLSVMHTSVPDTGPALDLVRGRWSGPMGAYPEAGYFEEPHWQLVDIIEPATLVKAARGWIGQGVQIVGGCCGLGADHIRALTDGLAADRQA